MQDLPTPFGPVLIVGTGMIGGSLGGLIRQTYGGSTVIGIDQDEQSALEAQARDLVTAGYGPERLERVASEAGLILLATPIDRILDCLPAIEGVCRAGALVLDVGSAKRAICKAAGALPRFASGEVGFIGGHPMAGALHSGIAAASPDILRGAPFVLCPLGAVAAAQRARARQFFEELGFSVTEMDPGFHDRVVAVTSHVPQLFASLLCNWVGEQDEHRAEGEPSFYEIAGGGLDRMTAKASGLPQMWASIISANAGEVTANLRELALSVGMLADTIEAGEVLAFLTAAHDRRALFEETNYRHTRDAGGR